ncbi:hypothetical protein MW290_32255 (plasmid) [Aquincola tertiaricarbonis]|uniref:Uncharacterized protein n=1 Tax=Aquincola tertiaricarbonis TaxID=391953 RepID=A0ABY4SG52_AQUTE|nr:hypothetical protein [Aquincola tertiaricarbonis]URI11968.1 hypothetical protein MW290_32255 [Aquincola tertiaricarbonis]
MQPDRPVGLRAYISDDRSSKISHLRRWWFEIDRLKAEGITDSMLVEAMARAGVRFTSRSSFATTLARVRKEIREGKFQPTAFSVAVPPVLERQQHVPSITLTELTPAPANPLFPHRESTQSADIDIYAPKPSKKELREQKASRINLDHPNTNPLLFAALKEQSK